MDSPRYTIPAKLLFSLAISLPSGASRSFRRDAQVCIDRLRPPIRILGNENIPHSGPLLLTFNHYSRPGFNAWWMALALAAALPVDIHFVMTSELTFPGRWYARLGMPLSRRLLAGLAGVYGFSAMPPMPPRPADVQARAGAVRSLLAYACSHPAALLAIAPEGGDQPGGVLSHPPAGAGRFLDQLSRRGFRMQPVGIFEQQAALWLNFGLPYQLAMPPGLAAEARDREAARQVMQPIAALLPDSLQGDYRARSE